LGVSLRKFFWKRPFTPSPEGFYFLGFPYPFTPSFPMMPSFDEEETLEEVVDRMLADPFSSPPLDSPSDGSPLGPPLSPNLIETLNPKP
jgi:hypothetical protein